MIIWDDHCISDWGGIEEEGGVNWHTLFPFFPHVFLSSVSVNRQNYCLFVVLNSFSIIALQPQVYFINAWLYVALYVLLDLKVHPSANKFCCSIIPHWLICDTFVINIHQSCCIFLEFVGKKMWSKRDFIRYIFILAELVWENNCCGEVMETLFPRS